VAPESLAGLVGLVEAKTVNRGAAKQVLSILVAEGGDPPRSSSARAWAAMSDEGELAEIVEAAIAAQPDAAEQIKAGNERRSPDHGVVMKETKGRADGARCRS